MLCYRLRQEYTWRSGWSHLCCNRFPVITQKILHQALFVMVFIQDDALWIVFEYGMTIDVKAELKVANCKTIDRRGVNIHVSTDAGWGRTISRTVIINPGKCMLLVKVQILPLVVKTITSKREERNVAEKRRKRRRSGIELAKERKNDNIGIGR